MNTENQFDPETAPATAASGEPAPDWALVRFDVCCARCGVDLRGTSEPTCAVCGLEFRWAEAVPVEQLTCSHCGYHLFGLAEPRCPECGQAFDWNEALDQYRRRRKPLFEYRWRERPVRSLVNMWILCLRPRKLWRTVDLHDPPQVGALLAMVLVTAACGVIGAILCTTAEFLVRFTTSFVQSSGVRSTIEHFKEHWRYFAATPLKFLWDVDTWAVVSLLAIWSLTMLCGLLLFRQSLQRNRLRSGHVIRVWAFTSTAVFLMFAVATPVVSAMVMASNSSNDADAAWIGLGLVLYVLYALGVAIRDYLRLDHYWGVALATQAIALLATMITVPLVMDSGWRVLIQFARLFGIW